MGDDAEWEIPGPNGSTLQALAMHEALEALAIHGHERPTMTGGWPALSQNPPKRQSFVACPMLNDRLTLWPGFDELGPLAPCCPAF
jgi:hypothetical protein